MAQDEQTVMCFKPLTHPGEDVPADLFLRNMNGTLVPFCSNCYPAFVDMVVKLVEEGDKAGRDDELYKGHKEWLAKPESERKLSLADGMSEFLDQEKAREDGSREGPRMAAAGA